MRASRALLVSLLVGCGGETISSYSRPDGSAWTAADARWQSDAGPAGFAFVTNSLESSVSVLDLGARRTLGAFPVGVVPLGVNGPHHLAVDTSAGALLTALSMPAPAIPSGPHAAHGSSTRPGVLVKRALDDFRLLGRADVDANPGDMALSPDGRRAFVTHFDLLRAQDNRGNRDAQRSNLVVVDTESMTVTHRIPLCVAAHGMTTSLDGSVVYTACYGDDAMGVVSFRTAPPTVQLVPIQSSLAPNPTSPTYGPYAVTRSPDGGTVWLSCSSLSGRPGIFVPFDTATNRFDAARAVTSLLGTPYFGVYSPDGGSVVLPLQNRDGIARVTLGPGPRPTVMQVPFDASECVLPHQIALGPDGLYYLVCEGVHDRVRQAPGVVLSLRPEDFSIVSRFPVGVFPDAIAFSGGAR